MMRKEKGQGSALGIEEESQFPWWGWVSIHRGCLDLRKAVEGTAGMLRNSLGWGFVIGIGCSARVKVMQVFHLVSI